MDDPLNETGPAQQRVVASRKRPWNALCVRWNLLVRLALVLSTVGCRRTALEPAVHTKGDGNEARTTVRYLPDAAGPDTRDATAKPSSHRVTRTLERVAALDAERVVAVCGGDLLRLATDRWIRTRLEGAEARDVVAARGALWALARGTGANTGRALILRLREDRWIPVTTPMLGPESDPRVLAVVRENEHYIGGARPALVHVLGNQVRPIEVSMPVVVSLRWLRDETLVVGHGTQRFTIVRWGERTTVEQEDYFDMAQDPDGFGFMVRTDGSFVRGRPGREISVVALATPFPPRAVTILPSGRPAAVGTGGTLARWERQTWQSIVGPLPTDPLAILATEPALVVGRTGEVVAVQGSNVRWVVHPGAIPGE